MQKKNEKGFALVLSLVLLMVMSLMGGSLVVISSSDHRSNNSSDVYQQAFYVAEHALLEAEREIINEYLNRHIVNADNGKITVANPKDDSAKGIAPKNSVKAKNTTSCYKSFKNINKQLDVVRHNTGINFHTLIASIFDSPDNNFYAGDDGTEDEEDYLKRFTYEYFFLNIGNAEYKESGSSVKKSSIDFEQMGTAYKIYACGMYNDNDIIIPIESVIVLPG